MQQFLVDKRCQVLVHVSAGVMAPNLATSLRQQASWKSLHSTEIVTARVGLLLSCLKCFYLSKSSFVMHVGWLRSNRIVGRQTKWAGKKTNRRGKRIRSWVVWAVMEGEPVFCWLSTELWGDGARRSAGWKSAKREESNAPTSSMSIRVPGSLHRSWQKEGQPNGSWSNMKGGRPET